MPIFEYEPISEPIADHASAAGETAPRAVPCEYCGGRFEVFQKMDDPPLTRCPTCDKPCRRTFSTFAVSGRGKSLLSKRNLEEHGFTQYRRVGKGHYEKTAGKGPDTISDGS